MERLAIIGSGATGTRVARQVARSSPDWEITLVDDGEGVAETAALALGPSVTASRAESVPADATVVVLATRAGSHADLAAAAIAEASLVISVSDSIDDVRALLDLDDQAQAQGCRLVVGAGMMPGLTDVLASHGQQWFDVVREIHVSKFGTGGPDCARQHHRALKGLCFDWRDNQWQRRAGGSGRELAWFPPPVQAADCYRAALADPLLLIRQHRNIERITSRMAATRRDRLTMHLPMLRKPHPEGLLGAVRVELRGTKDGRHLELVLGCAERPAVAAGVVAATAALLLSRTSISATTQRDAAGAFGLAECVDAKQFLHQLKARGLRPELFVGADETY